jgi:hypothetical protein
MPRQRIQFQMDQIPAWADCLLRQHADRKGKRVRQAKGVMDEQE